MYVIAIRNELERLKIDWYDIDAIASASASASANRKLSLAIATARRKLVMGLARRSCTEVLARR